MDGSRFDDLVRDLGRAASRRTLLKGMAAGIAAGLAAAVGGTAGAAPRCKRIGQTCLTPADCCPDQNGTTCLGGKKKTCQTCPAGQSICAGTCIATASDANNCGGCGVTCYGGSSCVNGACICPADKPNRCADGSCQACCADAHCPVVNNAQERCCGNVCVDTRFDAENCLGCGNVCHANQVCSKGCLCTEPGQALDQNGDCSCASKHCQDNTNCCDGYACVGFTGGGVQDGLCTLI